MIYLQYDSPILKSGLEVIQMFCLASNHRPSPRHIFVECVYNKRKELTDRLVRIVQKCESIMVPPLGDSSSKLMI